MRPSLVLVAALLASRVVAAGPEAEREALAHLDRGIAAYRLGDYEGARKELTTAHDLAPERANPYRWLALTDDKLGDCEHAVEHAEGFLSRVPAGDARVPEIVALREQCVANARGPAAPPPPASPPPPPPTESSILHRWWFWTAVGAVVLTGAGVTAYEVTRPFAHPDVAADPLHVRGVPVRSCALAALLAACTSAPCDDVNSACVTLHVTAADHLAIDQLELDLLYAGHHATATTAARVTLPADTAIELDVTGSFSLGVAAAGKLAGNVLGTGAGELPLATGAHATLTIDLAPPPTCVAGGRYCGGDKLAGNADTLYECNAGGVPIGHGVCPGACLVRPTVDDTCAAVGGPCTEGQTYCGGDKLEGDPRALYTCKSGSASFVMQCANTCDVVAGQPDACGP